MGSSARCTLQAGPLTVYIQELPGEPPLPVLAGRLPSETPRVWLDSARHHPATGRWSLLAWDPWLTLRAAGDRIEWLTSAATRAWRGDPLEALAQVLARYRSRPTGVPQARAIGLVGLLGYELNRWIEPLPPPRPDEDAAPDLLWFGMRLAVLADHRERRGWLLSVVDPHQPGPLARRQAERNLRTGWSLLHEPLGPPEHAADAAAAAALTGAVAPTMPQRRFEDMVRAALEHIRAGEIFQANLSHRFTGTWPGEALPLYARLRAVNPSPFACFLADGPLAVVSCSPERLVRVQEGRVDTRPIAGTRPRGGTPADDAVTGLELLVNEKERAEHIMLVDLARNDLGRVCRPGSVQVDELMGLEAYSHVLHIVSSVAGWLRPGAGPIGVIRAVFPGGTITGCPKVRCMQLLRELEPVPRGTYTGSVGYLGFDGALDLNIAIRTMVLRGPRVSLHVGAGIVADSDPEREYHETLAKAGALLRALGAEAPAEEPHAAPH